jgi:hypothetical protein
MKLTKEEKEIESLYESGKITTHKPNKAMLRRLAETASGTVRLIRRGESGKQKIDRAKIASVIRADRDAR